MLAVLQFPDISRNLFSVTLWGHELALRWYALAYLAGLIAGWRVIMALMARPGLWPGDRAPMEPRRVEDLLSAIVLGVILGGRLGFVLFYQRDYYLAHPSEILKVWEGGMSFHGGFLGVIAAGLWFCRRNGVPALQLSDAMALVAPIGLFFGRIANFINGELWGRVTDPSLPWAMVFPQVDLQPRHPSQLYQAAMEGLLLFALLWWYSSKPRGRGAVSGMFLVGYGAFRWIGEYFREPDAGIFGHSYVISMGQWLSLPMVAIGVFLVARTRMKR